jgi:glycosyltransferase involved in cell wall biosynthesis
MRALVNPAVSAGIGNLARVDLPAGAGASKVGDPSLVVQRGSVGVERGDASTTRHHLVFGSDLDLDGYVADALRRLRPGHVMCDLRDELGAATHGPGTDDIIAIDRARAAMISDPAHWALARRLAERLGRDDVVYCNGEDIGIPLAVLCKDLPNRPRIAIFFHSANRPRVRAMLRVFGLRDAIDVFVSNTTPQFEQLRKSVGDLPDSRWYYLPEQTDTDFFSPGPVSPDKRRPMIASVGLEKRDYRILADVTRDRDLDVKISGFSRDVRPLKKSFPDVMPANMSRGFYAWPDLVQLYRDADIVVVGLFESLDSAGITTLMEAMACGRPVICTRTRGLADYLDDPDLVTTLAPGDRDGLRAAIDRLLGDPAAARRMGERARERVLRGHASRPYVDQIARLMRSMR